VNCEGTSKAETKGAATTCNISAPSLRGSAGGRERKEKAVKKIVKGSQKMCRGAATMTRSLLAIAIQQLEKMVQLPLAFEAQ
jgi:hypothetical protein